VLAVTVLLVAAIMVGLLLEDVGSRVEAELWDNRLKRRDPNFGGYWDSYLRLEYEKDKEPLGQHYMRTILLRMKFELSFAIALLIALPGFVVMSVAVHSGGALAISLESVGLAAVSAYLFYESFSSAAVLARVRKLLVE
jgi:hypothetical protein